MVRHVQFLEFAKDVADLQALLEIVILVRIDELEVFAAVEYDGMVLVVGLAIPKNWITGQFDPELWSALASLGVELGMAVDERGEEAKLATFLPRCFFLEEGNLQVRVGTQ